MGVISMTLPKTFVFVGRMGQVPILPGKPSLKAGIASFVYKYFITFAT